MTRPITKNTPVLRSTILPEDDFGQPPNPADPPLTATDLHRINIYVFDTLCDPWTAAQKCGMSPAELVIYLDQPHIARFVRKARQAIHIHNFEAAAIHTRAFLQASSTESTRLRAAATLIRAYTRPTPRPTTPRATADDPPPRPEDEPRLESPRRISQPGTQPSPTAVTRASPAPAAATHNAQSQTTAASPNSHAPPRDAPASATHNTR